MVEAVVATMQVELLADTSANITIVASIIIIAGIIAEHYNRLAFKPLRPLYRYIGKVQLENGFLYICSIDAPVLFKSLRHTS
jgi:hypothetical protein